MTEKEIREAIVAAYPCRQVRIGDRVWMESPDGDLMYAAIDDLEKAGEKPDCDPWYFETENPVLETTQQPTPEDENRAYCKRIAHELEAYAGGNVYRCPDCGEEIRMPDNVGDKYRCPHCHSVADVGDYEQLGVYDYLSDVYDIEYRVGLDDRIRSVKIMVACGGPNIYIDTAEAAVKLYWWSDRAEYPISYDARDAVDEWAEELWGCR